MCGLSGFIGIRGLDSAARHSLVFALGAGIDTRGGHAAGFAVIHGKEATPHVGHRLGEWKASKLKFRRPVAESRIAMMHARYATCGKRTQSEAHPFEIRRNGQPILWGAHNGVLWNADQSAKKNNRKYDVDSREFFELLADNDVAGIQALEGYGMVTWIQADDLNHVYFAKLSSDADFFIAKLDQGGAVWGSTQKIVNEALKQASLSAKDYWPLDEVGRVYRIGANTGVVATNRDGIKVTSWTSSYNVVDWSNYQCATPTESPNAIEEPNYFNQDGSLSEFGFTSLYFMLLEHHPKYEGKFYGLFMRRPGGEVSRSGMHREVYQEREKAIAQADKLSKSGLMQYEVRELGFEDADNSGLTWGIYYETGKRLFIRSLLNKDEFTKYSEAIAAKEYLMHSKQKGSGMKYHVLPIEKSRWAGAENAMHAQSENVQSLPEDDTGDADEEWMNEWRSKRGFVKVDGHWQRMLK